MSEDKMQLKNKKGVLDMFEPGNQFGAINNRNEYDQRLNGLPPDQRELSQESARLADLSHYFSQQKMDIPPEILEWMGRLSRLAISDRVRALKHINQGLLEYLSRVGKSPQIWQ